MQAMGRLEGIESIGASAASATGLANTGIAPPRGNSKKSEIEESEEYKKKLREQLLQLANALVDEVMSFTSLVESLAASEFKGAPVLIPEIAIFDSGKPKGFLYFDKITNEIKAIYNKSRLNTQYLMKAMTGCYREKRANNKGKANLQGDVQTSSEQQSELPMVNVRYIDKTVNLTQGKFTQLMLLLPTNKIWQEIVYIQNYVVLSKYMPRIIKHTYIAPIKINDPKEKIKYQCEEIYKNNVEKQCCIIAHYMSKVHFLVRVCQSIGNIVHGG